MLSISLGNCSAEQTPRHSAFRRCLASENRGQHDLLAPAVRGPVPRNPDMNLPVGLAQGAGISFSRVSVGLPMWR